jgi:iron complex transport system substrate-binding protein
MIRMLGAMVGAVDRADALAEELAGELAARANRPRNYRGGPKCMQGVDDPMISGIAWVSELIEVAGGVDIFDDRASAKSAKDRVVTMEAIIAREPEVIIGSWCGKNFGRRRWRHSRDSIKFQPSRTALFEKINSSLILPPGSAALTDGLPALQNAIQ